jgi:Cu(I)/Ag(I) efflux system membrane fusion protein
MKMKNQLVAFLLAGASTLAFVNCGGKKEEAAHEGHTMPAATEEKAAAASAPQFTVDAAFQKQLSGVFSAYVALKEAFVATDAAKVKSQAAATATSLAATDMKLLTGAAHNDWMTYSGAMDAALKEMQATDDIEAQRTAFKNLSDNLYKSIKAFGLGGVTAYYEYCPMAFNDTGAYWLSDNSVVRNPYFGDKMLSCGSVEETLN